MIHFLANARECRAKFQSRQRTRVNGTAKDRNRLNDTWTKRVTTNVRGFWNEQEAKSTH